jgi:hypothetical protein
MINKIFFNLYLISNIFFIYASPIEYDSEEKDNILANKDFQNKLNKEYEKNGYILYTNEVINYLEKIDRSREINPLFCLVVLDNKSISIGILNVIKSITNKINNVFKNYKNLDNQNAINNEIIFIVINIEEKNINEDLRKFLRNIMVFQNIPSIIFLCRKKNCSNEKCRKKNKNYKVIHNYIVFEPINKFIDFLLEDNNNNIFKKIVEHGFEEENIKNE